MENIVNEVVLYRWAGDGRCEVQASLNEGRDEYGVRIAAYQENGRFAQYPPHIPPTEEKIQEAIEAIEQMAESARVANMQKDLGDIYDLVEEVGPERARDALEELADQDEDE